MTDTTTAPFVIVHPVRPTGRGWIDGHGTIDAIPAIGSTVLVRAAFPGSTARPYTVVANPWVTRHANTKARLRTAQSSFRVTRDVATAGTHDGDTFDVEVRLAGAANIYDITTEDATTLLAALGYERGTC